MCLDRRDGKLLWQKGTTWKEEEETHEDNPYCAASPVTDGERVIASFGSAGVFCYDLKGKELWHRDLGRQSHIWGYASSPVMYRNLCILYHGPDKQGFLTALDKRAGKTVWQIDEPPIHKRPRTDGFRGREDNSVVGSFSTPLIVPTPNRDELVMAYPQLLCAYDPTSGKELWRCDGLNELIYTSPIYGEGVIVVMGGFSGSLMGVKPGGNGNVTETARVWREERAKKNYCGSGVIKDGHIYLVNMEGFGQCIELKTGKVVWEERVKGSGPKSESWSSPVLVGDLVYVLNRSGETAVFKASPQFELVSMNSLGNELTNASHAISDGEIFIRTHQHLWCIRAGPQTAQLK
jgi:outer membrane protein assembly factor BamB